MTDEANPDQREHWGMVGHHTIARSACQLGPAGTKLAQLLRDNRDRIAISDTEIVAGHRYEPGRQGAFVALADVPDLVGRSTRPEDAANHFADMDQPGGAAAGGQTLMQLWHGGDGTWRTPAGWTAFHDSLTPPPTDEHRGALPFRAAQLYGLMVQAVRSGDVLRYAATAGCAGPLRWRRVPTSACFPPATRRARGRRGCRAQRVRDDDTRPTRRRDCAAAKVRTGKALQHRQFRSKRVAQGLVYLAPPLARSADYHLHVRGFKERGTTTTPFDRRRNLQLQINQKMYRHCPTFEMVVECV